MEENIDFLSLLQNLHFGKILLIIMLILAYIKDVNASEPMYYYDKYSVDDIYEEVYSGYNYSGLHPDYREMYDFYTEKPSLNKRNGNFSPNGATTNVGEGVYALSKSPNKSYYYKIDYYGRNEYGRSVWFYYSYGSQKSGIERGSLIKTVTGAYNKYPSNGVHSDGYWYVRRGLVNNSPVLTLSIPSENSYFV